MRSGFVLLISAISLVAVHIGDASRNAGQGGLKLEFGSVLRQTVAVRSQDLEFEGIFEFVQQYTRKRFPWSVPRAQSEAETRPEVTSLRKMRLIFSSNDRDTSYYDDAIQDRTGREHGVTRFISVGTLYRFVLSWTEKQLVFTHNFTVSLYPNQENMNIYSHSCYIQNKNESFKSNGKYLIPKYHNWRVPEKVKSLKHSDLYYHMDEELDADWLRTAKHDGKRDYVTDSSQSEACIDDESCKGASVSQEEFKYAKYLSKQFTVMSYNIWNMNSASTRRDGYERRIAHMRETILRADPDIIGVQEVRYESGKGRSLGPSQMETLAEGLTQYQYVFQPAQMNPNMETGGKTEEGVAIMSKYPIISHDYQLLFINRSDGGDMNQRVLLHAQIFIPHIGKVHVLNTHLSLSHVARERCMVQIWRYARRLEGPVMLTGDFNAEPEEPAVQYLLGKDVFPGEDRSRFVDAWQQHSSYNLDDPGYTFSVLQKNATKRIDFIFYKPGNGCCKTDTFEILDDGTRGTKAASDHLPLMATFSYEDHIKNS